MRNLVISGLILLALALICQATAPVQLSGSDGRAILSQIAVPVQANNTSANSSQTNSVSTNTSLWNWGGTPLWHSLNNSRMLTSFQYTNNGDWTPSI